MFTIDTTANDIAREEAKSASSSFDWSRISTSAMKVCAIGYWAVFWGMNGIDKLLNRTDVGVFTWYGKDRTNQFTEYFNRMNIDVSAIDPTLMFACVWELMVAVPLIWAATLFVRGIETPKAHTILNWGYVLSALTLIGFSAFDVVAGDRAELREHGLYLALLFGCAMYTNQKKASA